MFICQDESSLYWAVLAEDGTVHTWQVPCDEESVVDVRSSDGRLVASHSLEGYFVAQRTFPEGEPVGLTDNQEIRRLLDGVDADNTDDVDIDAYLRYRWINLGGYVDDQTVLAVLDGPDVARSHWLLDTPKDLGHEQTAGLVRGHVRYDPEPSQLQWVRAFGDGTWLTADDDSIQRWTLA